MNYDLEYDLLSLMELYVGETSFIESLIQEVSKARAPYIGKMKSLLKETKILLKSEI